MSNYLLNNLSVCIHLRLAVGPRPPQGAIPPKVGNLLVQLRNGKLQSFVIFLREKGGIKIVHLVGKYDREGHALLGLVSGVAEHQTLRWKKKNEIKCFFCGKCAIYCIQYCLSRYRKVI